MQEEKEKITYTTIVIGDNGRVYDLGEGEFPGKKVFTTNAFTIQQELVKTIRENKRFHSYPNCEIIKP